MKSIKQMTDIELAAFVSSHLRAKNIEVVLSGGACVSIYSKRKYVSMDLDLVNKLFADRSRIRVECEGLPSLCPAPACRGGLN